MRSSLLNEDFWMEFCRRIFGVEYARPAIDVAMAQLPGYNIRSTKIFFVNGGEDPWRWAGL